MWEVGGGGDIDDWQVIYPMATICNHSDQTGATTHIDCGLYVRLMRYFWLAVGASGVGTTPSAPS